MVEGFSIVAALATATWACALVVLHALPTGYDPVTDAVSDYGVGRYRVGYWLQVSAAGVAGLALAVALATSKPAKPSLVVAMLVVFAAARLAIPAFPTDQGANRFQTVKGAGHMLLAVTAFAAITVAAMNLRGTLRDEPAWHGAEGLVVNIPWIMLGAVVATGLALRRPRLRAIFGLLERLFYLSTLAWFFVISIELARVGG